MIVKVCGVTSVEDGLACAEAGADYIGINFVPSSVRRVEHATAKSIASILGEDFPNVVLVGVVADATEADLAAVRATGISWIQFHGGEAPPDVAAAQPKAFKAVPIGMASDVERARTFPGELLLLDSRVPGVVGGSGVAFDWSLVTELARERKVLLAGGLNLRNVAEAIRTVRPFGVDVASGVESAPRKKDRSLVRDFIAAARA